ncbi:hypothetical protein BWQ96_00358 [Gracilariopsis chorda]|uniref:Uncharacterized protein n=1 Tax=Gracilariopsis chorda TaxID=448386 RepID=A0A2V3J5J2_9FLOR|nr:hypothetical protein BWQ96_00358 [Gracilariopsis chorda]|eukprot:PXF49706.1 hypothetical protein BWQ96_00358 [Gracilariopsis chorda]
MVSSAAAGDGVVFGNDIAFRSFRRQGDTIGDRRLFILASGLLSKKTDEWEY